MNFDALLFFRAYIKNPRTVASVIPSSRSLERRVVQAAAAASADVIVELGAGSGGTTRALLGAMRPDAHLISVERTDALARLVERIDDPRLELVHGCASSIDAVLAERGIESVSAVVSGIPFSYLEPELAESIIRRVHAMLAPAGRFVAYQVVGSVADYARPWFGEPQTEIEPINVPPVRVFTWCKTVSADATVDGRKASAPVEPVST